VERLNNLGEIRRLLHQELVRSELQKLVDLERVEVALTTLDDATLSQLASQSRQANDQLQAGIGFRTIVILAAVAVAVIVIIVVAGDDDESPSSSF
jgi:hypothetical protein